MAPAKKWNENEKEKIHSYTQLLSLKDFLFFNFISLYFITLIVCHLVRRECVFKVFLFVIKIEIKINFYWERRIRKKFFKVIYCLNLNLKLWWVFFFIMMTDVRSLAVCGQFLFQFFLFNIQTDIIIWCAFVWIFKLFYKVASFA